MVKVLPNMPQPSFKDYITEEQLKQLKGGKK